MSVDMTRWETQREAEFLASLGTLPIRRQRAWCPAAGVALGLLLWLVYDRTLTFSHIGAYVLGGAALGGFLGLTLKDALRCIRLSPDGVTVVTVEGKETSYSWSTMQAARIDSIPICGGVGELSQACLLKVKVNRRIRKIDLSGLDRATVSAMETALGTFLREHGIAETAPGFRNSWEQSKAAMAAITFAASVAGMGAAYVLYYRTLGLILGVSFLFAGVVLALMSWSEKMSRIVVLLAALLVAGSVIYIHLSGISVHETLKTWEQQERQRNHAPW